MNKPFDPTAALNDDTEEKGSEAAASDKDDKLDLSQVVGKKPVRPNRSISATEIDAMAESRFNRRISSTPASTSNTPRRRGGRPKGGPLAQVNIKCREDLRDRFIRKAETSDITNADLLERALNALDASEAGGGTPPASSTEE